ncbi:hypothetical protein [Massilia sp. DD77]|uniref:hypothetical protein n=1 Tax=Massilia sp. DD77 TaxID=3109349 RepID=UPI002FFFFFFE
MNPFRRALLLLGCAISTGALAHDPSYGSHGMALFGDKDGLYASHLPLFRAPHDVQAVLQVRLADATLDRALRARMQDTTALWTIDPEHFELSRLAPGSAAPLRGFGADIYNGHFERGGQRMYAGARLIVEKVVLYRRLDPAMREAAEAHYLPVGKYLVKRLDSRPDYDHIVKLAAPAAAPVTIRKQGLGNPEAALGRVAPVLGSVYVETGDLR